MTPPLSPDELEAMLEAGRARAKALMRELARAKRQRGIPSAGLPCETHPDQAIVEVEKVQCPECERWIDEEELVQKRECSRDSCGSIFDAEEGRNCPDCNSPFTRKLTDRAHEGCDDSECEPAQTIKWCERCEQPAEEGES